MEVQLSTDDYIKLVVQHHALLLLQYPHMCFSYYTMPKEGVTFQGSLPCYHPLHEEDAGLPAQA